MVHYNLGFPLIVKIGYEQKGTSEQILKYCFGVLLWKIKDGFQEENIQCH